MTRSPPRIAVITPYHREPLAMLRQAHESVLAQGIGADHFLVADGHPLGEIDGWRATHFKLPRDHDDCGNSPRGFGALLAAGEDYDFVAFLDADNWYLDDHLASLHALWEQRGAPICASLRAFHTLDGAPLPIKDEDEDALRHVDTSALLIHRSGFESLILWLRMPRILAPIADRVFVAGLRHRRLGIASSGKRTVAFRTRYQVHYETAGVDVPSGAKTLRELRPAYDYLASGTGVTACVDRLGFWPLSYIPGL